VNRRFRFLAGVLIALALLPGCAALAPAPAPSELANRLLVPLPRFDVAGRIGVRYDGQGFSGNLRWHHADADDEILILSPLGQGVAQLMKTSSGVELVTSEQHVYRADSAENLTEQVLGWRLPLSGLRYWVLGLPSPDSSAVEVKGAGDLPARLTQDEWQIEYLDFRSHGGVALPGKILMQYRDLDIKLIVDRWDIPAAGK
jgi:outer membrane lipoprotein LolB